ncbi:PAS domain-containing sensor histidine kinase [Halobaculum gomorrense]|uniref:histidine kinase n=1 Tax=Halobaculum gomorrense TaxID=43928 RepID=A0A1M5SWT2_9EURY|nr:PAS domain-containing sensor histidine kinase [Halobaculum gomorrense]SHH43031.1 PAS domain S-box-containing protein [Halobaculum gomorrense]
MGDLSLGEILLDHAQDKIAVLTENGTFTYVNDAAESIVGYDADDLVGENAFEYVHPDDAPMVRREFERTVRSDPYDETIVTYRHRTRDGDWVWLESRMSNLTDEAIDGYVVSSRDITDQVTAEEIREEAAARLNTIASVSSDGLWLFTGDWSETLFVNDAVQDIYGINPERLYDDPVAFLEAIHPDDVSPVVDAMERLSGGESVDIEYRVNADEDFSRWVWVQAMPIAEDGTVTRIAGFSRDVTERHRREQHLVVMDNLLRHNLRNDLNVILGSAEQIAAEHPEAAALTEQIRTTGSRLLQTANKERQIIELLVNPQFQEWIDLVDAVETAAERAQKRHPCSVVDYSMEFDGGESAVVPSLARTAVVELVENGIVHCDDERPPVDIAVRGGDETVEIQITDNAAALPDIEVNVLTGAHEFGRDPIRHSGGLGIWLVYWCVELSNGEIVVETTEKNGNRIWISLPARTDEPPVRVSEPGATTRGLDRGPG